MSDLYPVSETSPNEISLPPSSLNENFLPNLKTSQKKLHYEYKMKISNEAFDNFSRDFEEIPRFVFVDKQFHKEWANGCCYFTHFLVFYYWYITVYQHFLIELSQKIVENSKLFTRNYIIYKYLLRFLNAFIWNFSLSQCIYPSCSINDPDKIAPIIKNIKINEPTVMNQLTYCPSWDEMMHQN